MNQETGVQNLPDFPLDAGGETGRRFACLGVRGYREAARYVRSLPYGRTSDRSDWRLVLEEGRGTCSTKHALLAALARENGSAVSLVLGFYEMDGENTPGVGRVLAKHGLRCVPEAHCFLAHDGWRVDLTREDAGDGPASFLYEEEIEPGQIGAFKVEAHREFVGLWAEDRGLDPARVWRAREECIAALTV